MTNNNTARVAPVYRMTEIQHKVFSDDARFVGVCAGRRVGKSHVSVYKALQKIAVPNSTVLYLAPIYKMVRRIFLPLIQQYASQYIVKINLSEFQITFRNGSILYLGGAKHYDSFRGLGLDYCIFDETADQPEEAWTEVVRGALADKQGGALFVGTPKGRGNWFYDIMQNPAISTYTFTTLEGGWVPASELEDAKRYMDERTYNQEFNASFESYTSQAYYCFGDYNNTDMQFDARAETWLCWDFNAGEKPMAVVLVQVHDGIYYAVKEFVYKYTNTDTMCQIIVEYLNDNLFTGALYVTGDHSGKRRESPASFSDYDIIDHYFKNNKDYMQMKRVTISVRDRVNSLNSWLKSYAGDITLYINFKECPALRNDLLRVEFLGNGAKLNDLRVDLTHTSDALSYLPYNLARDRVDIFMEN